MLVQKDLIIDICKTKKEVGGAMDNLKNFIVTCSKSDLTDSIQEAANDAGISLISF